MQELISTALADPANVGARVETIDCYTYLRRSEGIQTALQVCGRGPPRQIRFCWLNR